MSDEWWAFIFLMLVMKLPIVYLGAVVWYACKPPLPPEPAAKLVEAPDAEPECPWQRGRRRSPGGGPRPHAPTRRVPAAMRARHAYAEHK